MERDAGLRIKANPITRRGIECMAYSIHEGIGGSGVFTQQLLQTLTYHCSSRKQDRSRAPGPASSKAERIAPEAVAAMMQNVLSVVVTR